MGSRPLTKDVGHDGAYHTLVMFKYREDREDCSMNVSSHKFSGGEENVSDGAEWRCGTIFHIRKNCPIIILKTNRQTAQTEKTVL